LDNNKDHFKTKIEDSWVIICKEICKVDNKETFKIIEIKIQTTKTIEEDNNRDHHKTKDKTTEEDHNKDNNLLKNNQFNKLKKLKFYKQLLFKI